MSESPSEYDYAGMKPPKWGVGERLLVAPDDGTPFVATITEVDLQPDGSGIITAQRCLDAPTYFLP